MALRRVEFVARSRAMQRLVACAAEAATTPHPVLIVGEAGSGKRRVAEWIHRRSARAGLPLCWLDCTRAQTAYSAEFTALANQRHPIRSRGGTIVLDGIDRLAPPFYDHVEMSWLAFIIISPSAPVQLIATSRRTRARLAKREHAEQLLDVVRGDDLEMPPLRQRRTDIPQLVRQRLRRLCEEHEIPRLRPSADALEAMCRYRWPGNVRELEDLLERVVVTREGDDTMDVEDLPLALRPDDDADVQRVLATLAEVEREHILLVLQSCNNNRVQAAAALDISVNTLWRRLRTYGIVRGQRIDTYDED